MGVGYFPKKIFRREQKIFISCLLSSLTAVCEQVCAPINILLSWALKVLLRFPFFKESVAFPKKEVPSLSRALHTLDIWPHLGKDRVVFGPSCHFERVNQLRRPAPNKPNEPKGWNVRWLKNRSSWVEPLPVLLIAISQVLEQCLAQKGCSINA